MKVPTAVVVVEERLDRPGIRWVAAFERIDEDHRSGKDPDCYHANVDGDSEYLLRGEPQVEEHDREFDETQIEEVQNLVCVPGLKVEFDIARPLDGTISESCARSGTYGGYLVQLLHMDTSAVFDLIEISDDNAPGRQLFNTVSSRNSIMTDSPMSYESCKNRTVARFESTQKKTSAIKPKGDYDCGDGLENASSEPSRSGYQHQQHLPSSQMR